MLTLTPEEQAWLDAYRRVLDEQFRGKVDELIIYGSKARGDATPDSDVDLLILIRDGDWRLEKEIAAPGYQLAIGTDVVPSIQIYTVAEWQRLAELQSVFRESVDCEGVPVR
jgi:uncharacterized protein